MSIVCSGGSDRPPRTALGPRKVTWAELKPPTVVRPAIGTDQLPQRSRCGAQYSEQEPCQPRCEQFPWAQRGAHRADAQLTGAARRNFVQCKILAVLRFRIEPHTVEKTIRP